MIRTVVVGAFRVGDGPNRLLRASLWVLATAASLWHVPALVEGYPKFADVEIPLRAAARWSSGGEAYLPSAFQASAGYDLPFLYPPLTLPLLAPLAALPRPIVYALWIGAGLTAAWWLLRRLGVPARLTLLLMVWPPFFEGLLGGNVQVLLVAAFVAVFFDRSVAAWQPRARDAAQADRPPLVDGIAIALIPTLKVSQPHAWFALLRDRPRAALAGLGFVGAFALATLPFVGLGSWGAWVEQVGRASDPRWAIGGASLATGMPFAVGLLLLVATVLLSVAAPRPRRGAWTGTLTVLGSPSLRMFGLLFILPAMLVVRRELSLIAAALIATYSWIGLWTGILLVAGSLLLAERFAALREPDAEDGVRGRPRVRGSSFVARAKRGGTARYPEE